MSDTTELPPAMLDVLDYPDPDDLADEVLCRLGIYRSLIVTDGTFATFDDFLIYARWGVFIVRGSGNVPLGTFASIEAAISRGRTASRDHGARDEHADALR